MQRLQEVLLPPTGNKAVPPKNTTRLKNINLVGFFWVTKLHSRLGEAALLAPAASKHTPPAEFPEEKSDGENEMMLERSGTHDRLLRFVQKDRIRARATDVSHLLSAKLSRSQL